MARSAPLLYITFLTLNVATAATIVEIMQSRKELAYEAIADLARALVAAWIWIPYFVVSRRVRLTFGHRHDVATQGVTTSDPVASKVGGRPSGRGLLTTKLPPPVGLGLTMVVLGLLPFAFGVFIFLRVGAPAVVVIAMGLIASGILVACRKQAALVLFGATYVGLLAKTIAEVGFDGGALATRLTLATALAVLLLRGETRSLLN